MKIKRQQALINLSIVLIVLGCYTSSCDNVSEIEKAKKGEQLFNRNCSHGINSEIKIQDLNLNSFDLLKPKPDTNIHSIMLKNISGKEIIYLKKYIEYEQKHKSQY